MTGFHLHQDPKTRDPRTGFGGGIPKMSSGTGREIRACRNRTEWAIRSTSKILSLVDARGDFKESVPERLAHEVASEWGGLPIAYRGILSDQAARKRRRFDPADPCQGEAKDGGRCEHPGVFRHGEHCYCRGHYALHVNKKIPRTLDEAVANEANAHMGVVPLGEPRVQTLIVDPKEDACIICYNKLFAGDPPGAPDAGSLVVTNCGHVFHAECIRGWTSRFAQGAQGCPVCKQVIHPRDPKTPSKIRLVVEVPSSMYSVV